MTTYQTTLLALLLIVCCTVASADELRNVVPALSFTRQPFWLGNPSKFDAITRTKDGVRFEVRQPGRGMKWNSALPQAVDLSKMPWVVVRYRAVDAGPSVDYFVYLGGDGKEQNIFESSRMICDGQWRIIAARAKPFETTWIAVQLQAMSPKAAVEISGIGFYSECPKLSVEDALPLGKAKQRDFRPLDIGSVCNASHESIVTALNLAGWLRVREIAVSGVPFSVGSGPRSLAAFAVDKPSELRLALPAQKCLEIFVLLAAAGKDGGSFQVVSEPHQFAARVLYGSAPPDECIPARVPAGFGLAPGFAVYAIAADPNREAKQFVIRHNVSGVTTYLVAATVGVNTRIAPHSRPTKVSGAKPYAPAVVRPDVASEWITRPAPDLSSVEISDVRSRFAFRLKPGFSAEIGSQDSRPTLSCSGSLWRVRFAGQELESADFEGTVSDKPHLGASIALRDRKGLGIWGSLRVLPSVPGSIQMTLELRSSNKGRLQVDFPTLPSVRHSRGADLSYCFPRRGAVVNSIPIYLREAYSGSMPLQFMDVFGADGGICLLTGDRDLTYRYFCLEKDTEGVSLAVEYLDQDAAPDSPFRSVPTVIGFHDGDWHTAFGMYKHWLSSFYRPDAPRKDWFRRVFNFRQQFLRFYIPGGERYYDKKTKKYTFPEGIAEDVKAFGGVDYLHLFDWGASEKRGRCGDYEPWDEIGGLDAFRNAVQGTQTAGIPVGLYIEGYLIDKPSRIAQAHGKEWELLDPQGKPFPYFAPAMNMCSAVTAWQDYLASVYARIKQETGAMGYYCDQMGFADPGHFCYAPNHGHGVPEPPLRGQCEMLGKIRKALGSEVALYTEETPVDVCTQHQDGSFTYAISSVSDLWSPSHINLTRFALPDFKTFEIIICDHPPKDRLTSFRQIFFNGEGTWLEGPPDSWYNPELLAFIRKSHQVMTTYSDCFMSPNPIPLVPTGQKLVFANEFPSEKRTLWTLFNANYATVRGELLAVRHRPGARYYDAWNGREIKPRFRKDGAFLALELGPRDVGCVVQENPVP